MFLCVGCFIKFMILFIIYFMWEEGNIKMKQIDIVKGFYCDIDGTLYRIDIREIPEGEDESDGGTC